MALNLSRQIYAITPERADDELLFTQVEQALGSGLRWLQYRDKTSSPARRLRRARALVELCHRHDARIIINDDVDLCLQSAADGVHLGQSDGSLAQARRRLGHDRILGATCHADIELARQAAVDADYVAFGAFFPSHNKPAAPRAALDILRQAAPLGKPRVAIGGLTLDNAPAVIAAGADALAMISALFDAPDIALRCRQWQALWTQIHPHPETSTRRQP